MGIQISTKRTVSPCVPLSIPKTALGLSLPDGNDDNDDDVADVMVSIVATAVCRSVSPNICAFERDWSL